MPFDPNRATLLADNTRGSAGHVSGPRLYRNHDGEYFVHWVGMIYHSTFGDSDEPFNAIEKVSTEKARLFYRNAEVRVVPEHDAFG
ncbi:MAG TPA: hypothetical protein VMM78_13080 [Thermomicrobiales bacterium]|nr:hypothetical protein [Thermomicrobiales bacterium]